LANFALIAGVQRCWNAFAIYARIHLRALRTRLAHSGAAFHTKTRRCGTGQAGVEQKRIGRPLKSACRSNEKWLASTCAQAQMRVSGGGFSWWENSMLRTSADPQPFTSRAEDFCEAPDRSSTVLSRFDLVSAAIPTPAIRLFSWRVLLARWPKSDVGDAGVAGVAGVRKLCPALNVEAWPPRSVGQLQRHFEARRLDHHGDRSRAFRHKACDPGTLKAFRAICDPCRRRGQ
jgi:hypothetical protein